MSQYSNEMEKHVKALKVNDDAWELVPEDEGTAIVDSITGDWVAVVANSPSYSSSELAGVFLNSLQFVREAQELSDKLNDELDQYDYEFAQMRSILSAIADKHGTNTAKVAHFLMHLFFPES